MPMAAALVMRLRQPHEIAAHVFVSGRQYRSKKPEHQGIHKHGSQIGNQNRPKRRPGRRRAFSISPGHSLKPEQSTANSKTGAAYGP